MHRKHIYLIFVVFLFSCQNDKEKSGKNEWISTNREFWSEPGIYLDLTNSDTLFITRYFNFEKLTKHKYKIDSLNNLIFDDTLIYGNITKQTPNILLIKDSVQVKSFMPLKDYNLSTDTNELKTLLLSNEWQMNDKFGSFRIEFESEPWYVNPSKLKMCIRINESKGRESYDYEWWIIEKHRNSYFLILSHWQTNFQIYQFKSISDSILLIETCWADSVEAVTLTAQNALSESKYQNLRNNLTGTWQIVDYEVLIDSSKMTIPIKHNRRNRPFHKKDSVPIILDTYFKEKSINYTFYKNGTCTMENNKSNLRMANWKMSNDGKYIHTKNGWMNSMKIISISDSILITEKHEIFEYPDKNEWTDEYIREKLIKITVPNKKYTAFGR